jgi:hypothetical protein
VAASTLLPLDGRQTVAVCVCCWHGRSSAAGNEKSHFLAGVHAERVYGVSCEVNRQPCPISLFACFFTSLVMIALLSYQTFLFAFVFVDNMSLIAASLSSKMTLFSSFSTAFKVLIGVGIGIGSLVLLIGAAILYARWEIRTINNSASRHISQKRFTLSRIGAVLTIVLVVLMNLFIWQWTKHTDSSANALLYISSPEWHSEKILAWHPILMGGGFLSAQALAMISWSFFSRLQTATVVHVLCQFLALGGCVAGLYAIFRYKYEYVWTPSLTSMHSWAGIFTVALFAFTLGWGLFIRFLTVCIPDTVLLQVFDMKKVHKHLGLLTFAFSASCVVSGVMAYLPIQSCYFVPSIQDADPANHYYLMETGCKIGQGIGVIAMTMFVVVFFTVTYRGDSFGLNSLTTMLMTDNPAAQAPPSAVLTQVHDEQHDLIFATAHYVSSAPPIVQRL